MESQVNRPRHVHSWFSVVCSRQMGSTPPNPPSPPGPGPVTGQASPSTQTRPASKPEPAKTPWLWNVVLLDDQEHTFEYVTRMMQTLFGLPFEAARRVAQQVDQEGRAVCLTTHKEHAELKRDQILAFGRDNLIASCKGSMSSIIEPAPQ